MTLLVEIAAGLREPLPAADRGARGHAAEAGASRSPPALDPALLAELNEGLVCLSGCARARARGARPERRRRELARAFGPRAVLRRAPAAVRARRRAPQRARCASSRRRSASQTVATGDAHAHHPRRAALQDALVAIRHRTSLDGCERERRGNHESVLLAPGAAGGALPARPRRRRRARPSSRRGSSST